MNVKRFITVTVITMLALAFNVDAAFTPTGEAIELAKKDTTLDKKFRDSDNNIAELLKDGTGYYGRWRTNENYIKDRLSHRSGALKVKGWKGKSLGGGEYEVLFIYTIDRNESKYVFRVNPKQKIVRYISGR